MTRAATQPPHSAPRPRDQRASLRCLFSLLWVITSACEAPPEDPPPATLSGEVTVEYRDVGEGIDISVVSAEERLEVLESEEVPCPDDVPDCSFAVALTAQIDGSYRDYSTHPVEGDCCDERDENRRWGQTLDGSIAWSPDGGRLRLTEPAQAPQITTITTTTRTTGEILEDTRSGGWEDYEALLLLTGSELRLEPCADADDCFEALGWTDATGATEADWPGGSVSGRLIVTP